MKYWLAMESLQVVRVVAVVLVSAGFCFVAARGAPMLTRVGPFLLSVLMTQLAITVHNDYCDRELDAKAKPSRPIPRGKITASGALRWASALASLAILIVVPLGIPVAAMVAVGTIAGLVYNAGLKRTLWCVIPFWLALPTLALCSFVVVGRFDARLFNAYIVAAPLVVAIYLADTLPDVDSDLRYGVRGLAQRLGSTRAQLLCWVALGLANLSAFALWPTGVPPMFVIVPCLALVVGVVVVGAIRIRRLNWLSVMLSAATLAVAWLAALVA